MNLGEYIECRRNRLGMTREQLGEMIGKNRVYIWRIETGQIKSIKSSDLTSLADALKCTIKDLISKGM